MAVLQFPLAAIPAETDPPAVDRADVDDDSLSAQAILDLEHLNIELQNTVASLSMRLQQERASRLHAMQAYPYLWTSAGVVAATAAAAIAKIYGVDNAGLFLVFPIIAASVMFGRWPALFGVVLQAVLFNLFVVKPMLVFSVPTGHEWFRIILYAAIPFMIDFMKRLNWPPPQDPLDR